MKISFQVIAMFIFVLAVMSWGFIPDAKTHTTLEVAGVAALIAISCKEE